MTSRALAAFVGITEQNLSLLKSGKVKGIRFDTPVPHLRGVGMSAR
ncbi:DNA-binding protein [Klebsiella variicola]|uniref:DNA-binding protein n=1 Tax=Klebsiella variicola TaxID=244366 RepID=A0A7H4MK13_KLEVA|nr:DNA-binding protein [Klebsiella variicola]